MADDGSRVVAERLRAMATVAGSMDSQEIVQEMKSMLGITSNEALCFGLARLIDPVTQASHDGSCYMCGAGPEAMHGRYCSNCGRRIVRKDGGDDD